MLFNGGQLSKSLSSLWPAVKVYARVAPKQKVSCPHHLQTVSMSIVNELWFSMNSLTLEQFYFVNEFDVENTSVAIKGTIKNYVDFEFSFNLVPIFFLTYTVLEYTRGCFLLCQDYIRLDIRCSLIRKKFRIK